jgi:hypothetical protein
MIKSTVPGLRSDRNSLGLSLARIHFGSCMEFRRGRCWKSASAEAVVAEIGGIPTAAELLLADDKLNPLPRAPGQAGKG